jgi:PAS domain S-box-containing protein
MDGNGFSYITENIEDYAIILLDPTGRIEEWNLGAENIKGYTSEEIVGRSFKVFYTPEDLANNLPEKLLAQATTNHKATSEGWRVRKDGSRFWGSISITAIFNTGGELDGFIKVTRDLSERKKAEELLMQKNASLLEAERTARMCSWTWDVNSDTFGWSEAACNIFNIRLDYTLDYDRFIRMVHEDDRETVGSVVQKLLHNKDPREFRFRISGIGNVEKDVLVCAGKMVLNADGTVARINGTLQDVTEKMNYINHIREKNRRLAEIAQVQSHIVRSQVANILGICEVFDLDNMNNPENKELILELKRSTEKLDKITRSIVEKTYENAPASLPGEWK